MLIPKKNRIAVYAYLFKEGVLVAKKDFAAPKHAEIEVPNLQVIKLMQSLKSRNYVKENFNWQYFYYYLTNEGIEYLREYLHLPSEIVPVTLKKKLHVLLLLVEDLHKDSVVIEEIGEIEVIEVIEEIEEVLLLIKKLDLVLTINLNSVKVVVVLVEVVDLEVIVKVVVVLMVLVKVVVKVAVVLMVLVKVVAKVVVVLKVLVKVVVKVVVVLMALVKVVLEDLVVALVVDLVVELLVLNKPLLCRIQ